MANNISESREMAKKLFTNVKYIQGVIGWGVKKAHDDETDTIKILIAKEKRDELAAQIPSWYGGHPVILEEAELMIY